ncbi:MAG: hypothetical protein ABI565_01750, partial [Vicinamibacteria bacterium]
AAAYLAHRGRIPPSRAAVALAALAAADLIRCGAGLNGSVTQAFYDLSPEMASQLPELRGSGGRLFTCDPEASQTFWDGRHARGAYHEAFSMAVMQEALTPDFNVTFRVKTALSIDRTSLVPANRVLSPELATCADFPRIAPALRAAGVNRVLSLDRLNDPGLRLRSEVSPPRIAPVTLRIYELVGAMPRFNREVRILADEPGRLGLAVTAGQRSPLTILDPFAPGWHLTVNGAERPLTRTADGHREVALDQGFNELWMSYEPPGLRTGISISVLAGLVSLGLLSRGGARI